MDTLNLVETKSVKEEDLPEKKTPEVIGYIFMELFRANASRIFLLFKCNIVMQNKYSEFKIK